MNSKEILEIALCLKPQERFLLIEGLIESIDYPDKELDEIWATEAEKRVVQIKAGKVKIQPGEEVFRDLQKKIK